MPGSGLVIETQCSKAKRGRKHAQQQEFRIYIYAMALITFPACFLCALYRLDINKVPPSLPRSILAGACTPLRVRFVRGHSCLGDRHVRCFIWTLGVCADKHSTFPEIVFFMAGVAAILVVGNYTAHAARDQIGKTAAV